MPKILGTPDDLDVNDNVTISIDTTKTSITTISIITLIIFFNTFFSFILCRLRDAVKQPINGPLYTQVIENYIIIEANTDSVVHYVRLLATVE